MAFLMTQKFNLLVTRHHKANTCRGTGRQLTKLIVNHFDYNLFQLICYRVVTAYYQGKFKFKVLTGKGT